ncbi:MAG: tetratricopeptide (TPR) repeat protein [Candidatus Paceibacteria bacterium]|jgi:tetratricopeptide (TPR) repeat protein
MKALLLLLLSSWVPTFAETPNELRARWLESIELNSPAEVVREARSLFAQDSSLAKDGEALALYARALSATGGTVLAFELLEGCKNSDSPAAIELGLARLELGQDRLTEVIQRLTQSQAGENKNLSLRYPEQADSWWLVGKAQARLGQSQTSQQLLQHFVQTWRLHPQAPSAWHLLSASALARRDLESASKYRAQGQNLSTWHAFYKTRRLQVREDPMDSLPHYGLAQLWSSVDELAQASSALDRSLEIDPEFARGWALRGELRRKQGNDEAAYKAYNRALELDATLTDARFNRALLAIRAGQSAAALTDLRLIVTGPESSAGRYLGAHLALSRLLKELGHDEEAAQRYARYRELGGTE